MNACTGNNSPIDDITRVVSARSDREGGRLNDRPRVYAKTGRRFDGAGAALFDTRRVIAYGYDHLLRQTSESWYDDVDDQTANLTYTTTYNDLGQVASIGDGATEYEYTYGLFGNLTSTTQDLPGLTPDVKFAYRYDSSGRLAEVAAFIGPVADYVTTYSYDRIGRITRIEQDDAGGKPVAEKRVDFDYDAAGDLKEIKRYAELAAANLVARTDYVFDSIGRLTDLAHARNQITLADYDLAWDAAGRITDFDFTSLIGNAGTAGYAYDNTDQLTGADYDFQTDESYSYDENGNRTNTGYSTGDHNRLSSDGTYNYTYDGEGNVTSKTKISDSTSIEYTWDHRNRLVKVTFKNSGGTPTRIVEYTYDNGQRWIRKTLDTNADGTIEQSQIFVHDQGQIVLDFQKTGAEPATTLDLARRYLWGPAVDQLLADETVDDGTADDVSWVLGDHLNSVRDLAVYDPVTQMVSVVKHVTFDAFGNVTSDSAPGVKLLFLYTARPFDPDSALQNNGFRWYDLSTARWMSVDPIGFAAGDVNLYRYCFARPLTLSDPNGLAADTASGIPVWNLQDVWAAAEPTSELWQRAVWSRFGILNSPEGRTPQFKKQQLSPAGKMFGWTFAFSRNWPSANHREGQPGGTSDFFIRWEIDAKITSAGCCDWSGSWISFNPIYNVFQDFGTDKSWLSVQSGAKTYLTSGPSVEEHEIWHLYGHPVTQVVLTHVVDGGIIKELTKNQQISHTLRAVKGMVPEASDRWGQMKARFTSLRTVRPEPSWADPVAWCRAVAHTLYSEYFLDAGVAIASQGVFHQDPQGLRFYTDPAGMTSWVSDWSPAES